MNLIWGCGALGSFLAWDLLSQNLKVFAFDENPSSLVYLSSQSLGLNQYPFLKPFLSLEKIQKECFQKFLRIFVCVPPQEAQNALEKILFYFEKNSFLEIILCFNGLTPSLVKEKRKIKWIRALFLVGFQGKEYQIVEHTGGKDLFYGSFFEEDFTPPSSSFLIWNKKQNIEVMEKHKFFINFILALKAQKTPLTNKQVLDSLSSSLLQSLVHHFCAYFKELFLNPEELVLLFQKTCLDTSSNINSVTLARLHGNEAPWLYFKETEKNLSDMAQMNSLSSLIL